jgi:DNA-binding MarR family transcriptional regulator
MHILGGVPPSLVARVLAAYPLVHHACRRREVSDPGGRHRVSAHQATVLAQLDPAAGLMLTELAGRMGVALPTMSLLVDRLARAGLIRRERDPHDRRRAVLRLTPRGEQVRSSHSLLDPERVRALLARLTARERAQGVAGLVTLARAARQLAEVGPAPTEPSG